MKRDFIRWKSGILALVLMVIGLSVGPVSVGAQDPAEVVELAALAAHTQNLRTQSYTYWLGGNLGDPSNQPRVLPPIGEPLLRWELPGLDGDDAVSPDTLTRPTLLNFWASWCPPCRLEFPHLVKVALAPDDHAFDVVFVDMADDPQDALAYLAQYPAEIHTVVDEDNRVNNRAGVDTIPTSLLLDTDGTVLAAHVGVLTPTVMDFFDAVATDPGVGLFVAAEHMDVPLGAVLDEVALADATPIAWDETDEGELTEEMWQHVYRFDGRTGDSIRISMKALNDDLDTYLVLMHSDGLRLAENDDLSPSTDSRIDYVLPADDSYLIVATRFLEADGFAVGPYTLTLSRMDSAETDSGPESMLVWGETVSGEINDSHFADYWTFEGQRGEVIQVMMTRVEDVPGGLDGWLILIGPDGRTLAEVDDTDESVMPSLNGFRLPDDGIYTLVATRYQQGDGLSQGAYTLALTLADEMGDNPAIVSDSLSAETEPLAADETVTGAITSKNVADWYTFEGVAGNTVTIVMQGESGGVDAYLMLYGPSGAVLAEVDDQGRGNSDARIDQFELPSDGSYTLRATRYGFENGPSEGAYTLSLTVK